MGLIEKVNNQSRELGSFLSSGVLCAGRNNLALQAAAFQQGTEPFKSHEHEKMYKQANGFQKNNPNFCLFLSFYSKVSYTCTHQLELLDF